jgi:hypothetical protein
MRALALEGQLLARSCPCARGDFCRPVAEAVWANSDPKKTSTEDLGPSVRLCLLVTSYVLFDTLSGQPLLQGVCFKKRAERRRGVKRRFVQGQPGLIFIVPRRSSLTKLLV